MERLTRIVPVLLASSGLALAACSRSHEPTASTSTANSKDVATTTPDASSSGTPAATNAADADQQASLAAREQDLAAREAALKQQQQDVQDEIARRDAMIAAEKSRPAHTTSTKSAMASNGSSGSSAKGDSPAVLSHQPEPSATLASTGGNSSVQTAGSGFPTGTGQNRFTVPAGTPLQIELTAGVNTKKAHVGDTVTGRLHSPIMVGDTDAVETGSQVTGTVTQVISGGNQIGGVPTLGLTFDTLVAEDGTHVPINAQFVQQGTSDTVKDTAKIVGGAAAGAVVGHQVNNSNKGTIIGGILGGAAGAAAAKNTGGEVKLPSGTVLSVTTESSFQVER